VESGVGIQAHTSGSARAPDPSAPDRYKWIALSNVTLGVLLATLDGSITLAADGGRPGGAIARGV
jgi:hypothetical protein